DASRLIRLKHSRNVLDNLQAVRDVMNLANQEFEATAEQYRRLARTDICQADVRRYVHQVLGVEDEDLSGRMKTTVETVLRLFEEGSGNDTPAVRGTVWAAYNAVTDWLSHVRGKTDDTRLNSLWFGDSATLNKRALEMALAL